MIPFNELKAPAVGLAWHEAAALVLETAEALRDEPGADLSDLSALYLPMDGRVVIRAATRDEPPVVALSRVLDALLESIVAPEALRQVARCNIGTAPVESLEAFVSAVAVFERPDRIDVLAALAERAAGVDRGDTTAVLEHLASRVREEERARPPARRERSPRASRPVALLAGIVVAASAGAFLAVAYFSGTPRPGDAPAGGIVARVRGVASRLIGTAREAPPAGVPAAAPSASPQTQAPSARSPWRAPTRPTAPAALAADFAISIRSLGGHAVSEVPAPTGATTFEATVYTSTDAGVAPARLIRPHLPTSPPADVGAAEIGVLELTVSESGRVDHVKLISPANRFQDRMLVSAAKAWLFQPATKDGRPVRFRARVQITL